MNFAKRLSPFSTPKVTSPPCPVPPPCPVYDLEALKREAAEEERLRILKLIRGTDETEIPEPIATPLPTPEPLSAPEPLAEHPDIALLETKTPTLSISEVREIKNAFDKNNVEEFKDLLEKHKSKILSNYMSDVRNIVIPSFTLPWKATFKKLNDTKMFDEAIKGLLGNVKDANLKSFKTGKEMDIGSIRKISKDYKNEEAVKYFDKLFDRKGGRTRKRKTRRRKSRRHLS